MTMKVIGLRVILWVALVLGNWQVATALQVADIFSDHMGLQRNREVPVWGRADAGGKVTVEFGGQTKTVTVDKDGKMTKYSIALPQPREVKVRVNGETKAIRSEESSQP